MTGAEKDARIAELEEALAVLVRLQSKTAQDAAYWRDEAMRLLEASRVAK